MAPLKILLKLIYKVVIGGTIIFLFNLIGRFFGVQIALNIISALFIGFLGFPGLILLITLKIIF
ncbi:MAG: pro-sigmaK processing inhibitor BofA family protein [Firmicutes bacterium]|nr:pro-sigmaK processing inhibitor BofA family protein [Bacillota bacterium]